MTKRIKTFQEALTKIKQDGEVISLLCRQKDEMQDDRDKAIASRRAEYEAKCSAQREAEETRKQFADLKERLLNSEKEVSRLSGYLERVREDDNVADPLVEVDDQYGKRMVSKRYPSTSMNHSPSPDYLMDHMSRREKQKHWTSY